MSAAVESPAVANAGAGFNEVLDSVFERLQDMQREYSLRRIEEMDALLKGMERELDRLGAKTG